MPRRVYVDCPSTKRLVNALRESPYTPRLKLVPDSDILPLLQYLQRSDTPPVHQWVRIKIRGAYKNQVGIVAENGGILAKRIHKKLPGNPPVLIIPVHPEDADVQHVEGLYAFTLKKGTFEVIDPVIDQDFIDSVSRLLISTTARNAWYAIWSRSWPDGSVARRKGTLRQSKIVRTDVENVYLFEGVPVPSSMLHRIYSAGDELVVIFGSYAGQVVRVIEHLDGGELVILLLERVGNEDRSGVLVPSSLVPENSPTVLSLQQQITYQRVHCTQTLDYSPYSHLSLNASLTVPIRRPKTIGRRHRLVDPHREQTLPGTANLIGRPIQIQKGPLKGYKGILRLVTLMSTIVELEALTGNKLKSFKHSYVLIGDPSRPSTRPE